MKLVYYDTILSPVVSEKSNLMLENNQVMFNVSITSKKNEIKKSIEALFSVKVKKVNILIRKGKKIKFKGISGKKKNTKKAILTLFEGQSIDFSEGIEE